MPNKKDINISICMGSSCYPRGNRETLERLKSYIEEHNLGDKVFLQGNLCEGLCKDGPNIKINGEIFHEIDYYNLINLVEKILNED